MSFSVQSHGDGLEYSGSSLNTLFAQRRNLLRPRFYRMIRDILRFNKTTLPSIDQVDDSESLRDYLRENHYSPEFIEHYLIPMAAAIWSAEPVAVLDMPVKFLVRFFANHGLLQLKDRPTWHVIEGGSREYVRKLTDGHRDRIRLNSPVESLNRFDDGIELYTASGGVEVFDYVFLACHSDQALSILRDPSNAERSVLGAIPYQRNEAILHTDEALMPKRRKAWAAWNYHVPKKTGSHVAVTYNMNILQGLPAENQYLVTLNNDREINPEKVIRTIQYEHPVFSRESVAAQERQRDLNKDRTFFCGAYWKNGFHEDGVVSARNAVSHFEERRSSGKLHLRRAS